MVEKLDGLKIYTDGGSRGNPGPAAAGYLLVDSEGRQLEGRGIPLGTKTNNEAEYLSVCSALEAAGRYSPREITLFSDSELLVRQVNGDYKVKSKNIRPLFKRVVELLRVFDCWRVEHIVRERNEQADRLVNRALDFGEMVALEAARHLDEVAGADGGGREPIRLGVLISGGGRTLLNIDKCIKQGRINAEVSLVISSRSTVKGVERAREAGFNVKVIRRKDFADVGAFSGRLESELVKAGVELVIQAGWLCYWKIPQRYVNRVMNIHPALLPCFGGKGMYGHYVHEAVLKAGCKVSGCTVHFCTNEYDKGPIIIQRVCPVEQNDTADSLAERVFGQECIAYPLAIELFERGELVVHNGVVKKKSALQGNKPATGG